MHFLVDYYRLKKFFITTIAVDYNQLFFFGGYHISYFSRLFQEKKRSWFVYAGMIIHLIIHSKWGGMITHTYDYHSPLCWLSYIIFTFFSNTKGVATCFFDLRNSKQNSVFFCFDHHVFFLANKVSSESFDDLEKNFLVFFGK